jgi:amino-acid N-acetyltransferase
LSGLSLVPESSAVQTVKRVIHVGSAIRSLRLAQNLTLEQLADSFGSDAGNLSRVERGQQDITEADLRKVAARLGVKVSDLWLLAESPSQPTTGLVAKIAKMPADQVKEVDRFVDYLLSKNPDSE